MKQWVFFGCLVLTLLLVAVSCGTTGRVSQDRYIYSTDTLYVDRTKIDSVYIRDSVYIHLKADTVMQYRDRYEYRYIYLRDTSYVAVHDTTYVEVTKEVPVEKELNIVQRVKQKSFWWLIAAVLGFGGWTFRKPIMKIVKRII